MKRYLIFFLCLLACSCKTAQKVTTDVDLQAHTEWNDSSGTTNVENTFIDTTMWENGEWTHIRIEFEPDTMPRPDSGERPTTNVNIGGINIQLPTSANLKSIEQTTARREAGRNGITERRDSTSYTKTSKGNADIKRKEKQVVTPVNTISWWKVWTFAAIALSIIIAVIVYRKKFASWLNAIVAVARAFI